MNSFLNKIRSLFASKESTSVTRKGAGLEDMLPAVVTFGLVAIVGAVVALILQNFQSNSTVTVNSIAYNAIGSGLSGVNTLMSFLPLIALVIVAAIIIGVVLLAFAFRGRSGGERY